MVQKPMEKKVLRRARLSLAVGVLMPIFEAAEVVIGYNLVPENR